MLKALRVQMVDQVLLPPGRAGQRLGRPSPACLYAFPTYLPLFLPHRPVCIPSRDPAAPSACPTQTFRLPDFLIWVTRTASHHGEAKSLRMTRTPLWCSSCLNCLAAPRGAAGRIDQTGSHVAKTRNGATLPLVS